MYFYGVNIRTHTHPHTHLQLYKISYIYVQIHKTVKYISGAMTKEDEERAKVERKLTNKTQSHGKGSKKVRRGDERKGNNI